MKMELKDILEIMDKVKATGIELFEYENEEERIRIKGIPKGKEKEKAALPEPAGEAISRESSRPDIEKVENVCKTIQSPMVGTFYQSPAVGEAPFVQKGDRIKKGQTIGIVEAMKLMNEIESEWDGIVEEILAENEQLVEFGQPLIRLRPLDD